MIEGYEYGIPHLGTSVYCIRREDAGLTLCGRRIDRAPIFQPLNPPTCRQCLEALPGREAMRRPKVYGTCPVCGGEVPLADGVCGPHPEWVVGRGGPTIGKQACRGEGQEPE